MKRLIFYLATLCCMNNILFAQHAKETIDENRTGAAETERIFKYFSDVRTYSAEKLYLHLNQPYYAAGDTVWFRAYLVNAMTHCPDTLSNFLYVDLFDRKNSFVLSRKIKRDSIGFSNCLPLPDTLSAGEYTLRAYTGWMLNFDPALHYQRNLTIGTDRSGKVHTDITYAPGRVVIRFIDWQNNPIRDAEASYTLYDGGGDRLNRSQQRTSTTGALFVDLPHDSVRNGGYIELRLDKDGAIRYRQTLFLKPEERSFSVQFFPEGGELVDNVPRLVAFKAEGSDGYPVDFSGTVLNGNGDSLVRFRSEHDGMGTFLFCPQQGETYRVICESAGRRITLPLPAVVEHACALTVVRGPEHIRYRVDGPLPSGALLVGHIRGDCCCVAALSDQRPSGAIPIDSLPEGVLHLLLIDSAGYPLSERLVFVGKPQSGVGWEAVPDRLRYGRRERVRLKIAQTGVSERFLPDNLSVSVTNRNVMKGDSLGDDIRTNLLLTSDLKGYIHNPGYYFLDDSPGRRYHLDLVMLTHGWRRFSTKNLFSPSAFSPEHFIEQGQYISGRVRNAWGREVKSATVTAIALNKEHVAGYAETDETGRFLLSGLDFCDTAVFVVSARNKRNKTGQQVDLDALYPRPELTRLQPWPIYEQQERAIMDSCFGWMRDDSSDIREFELESIEVVAPDMRKPPSRGFDVLYDTTRLSKFKALALYRYITLAIPEVRVIGDTLYLKNMLDKGYEEVKLRVNGHDYFADLNRYDVKDVEYINLVRSEKPYRIDIYLKEGVEYGERDFIIHKAIGYSEKAEFYHPIYDTPERFTSEKTDRRSTLYWNPYLLVSSDGKTFIEFYSDDSDDPRYEITIEGVTPEGIPVHYRSEVRTE